MGGAAALAALRVVAPAIEEFGAELLLQSLGQIGGEPRFPDFFAFRQRDAV